MVALPNEPTRAAEPTAHPAPGPFAGLLLAWRRLVTAAFRAAVRGGRALAASRPARAIRVLARYARDPAGTLAYATTDDRARLKEAGAAALVIGVALSFAIPSPIGVPLVRRFLAAGWTAAWALARLLVMRTVAKGELARRRSIIGDAWGPALAPYALAVIDPLPMVAFVVSGALTLRGLVALGAERREARRVVAIGFGVQLVAETASWLARGGLLYLLAVLG